MKNQEHLLQVDCCKYLQLLKNMNKIIEYFAVPNGALYGAKNNLAYGSKMKREGVKSGVSDLVIVFKNKILFVELKHGKNKQTDSQKTFEKHIKKANPLIMQYHLIYDFNSFANLIDKQ